MYAVYGGGPPPLPKPAPVAVEEEEDFEVESNPWTDPEEIKEYLRDVDRRVEAGQEAYRQKKAADEFAMRAMAFGIAGVMIKKITG
jgi:hypothetical protein